VHPLDSARLKFDRACEHIDSLHEQVGRFLKEEPRRVLDKAEPKTGGYVRYIESVPTPPEWSVLLGEIAQNFHSCLDHIAWQLAVAASPTGNPEDQWAPTKISFPFFSNRRKYLGERNRAWRHVGLLPEHRRLVRKAQPYQRRNAPKSHPLWHLYRLSNIDKHQVLHTTLVGLGDDFPRPGAWTQKHVDPVTGDVSYIYELPRGVALRLNAGVIFEVGGPSHGDLYFEGDIPFQVEIEQPGEIALHGEPVMRLVNDIREAVRAILASFEPLL
jgi:hypothetical protein